MFKDQFLFEHVAFFFFSLWISHFFQQQISPTTSRNRCGLLPLFCFGVSGFLRTIQKTLWLPAVSCNCPRTPATHSICALWTCLNSWQMSKSRWMLQRQLIGEMWFPKAFIWYRTVSTKMVGLIHISWVYVHLPGQSGHRVSMSAKGGDLCSVCTPIHRTLWFYCCHCKLKNILCWRLTLELA